MPDCGLARLRCSLAGLSPCQSLLLQISGTSCAFSMLSSAISTVLTPVFRLLLFCFTAFRSSVIVRSSGCRRSAVPASAGCCGSAQRSAPSPGCLQTVQNLRAWLSLRSSPGELASSVYSAPGTRSSTSSSTPKSRLNAAQSSCVMPESCSTLNAALDQPFRKAPFPRCRLRSPPSACARPSAFFSR